VAGKTSNVTASVHQRLLNMAKDSSQPFNEVLQHFANERFIYRLSKSPHAHKFVLKGALMFAVWNKSRSRSTMDIDLLGRIDNDIETIMAVIKDVCLMDVEEDGISFHENSVKAERITEGAEYEGVRIRVRGGLGNTRLSLQIDIGFGDFVVPGPHKITYPTLLDFPPPVVQGYTIENIIHKRSRQKEPMARIC